MALPAQEPTIEAALTALKNDPTHPVLVRIHGMEVELRALSRPAPPATSSWPEHWFETTAGSLPDFERFSR